MAGWSETPRDILESIFERLGNDLMHKFNFGGVCRNWRVLVAEKEIDILPRVMLVGSFRISSLFTLSSTNNMYNIHRNLHAKMCCGSIDGFLITVDRNSGKIHLLNPILGAVIQLPTPSVLGLEQQETGPIDSVVISCLLENDGYVIVFRQASGRLHFCRLGSENWVTLKINFGGVHAIKCYKDKLYVINTNKNIDVFDIQTQNFVKYMIKLHDPVYHMEKHRKLRECYYTDVMQLHVPTDFEGVGKFSTVYLVDTPDDALLMVVRYGKYNKFNWHNTVGFKVFRQAIGGDNWEAVKSLNQQVLFIGHHSLCLTANDALKCQKDSIYFANSSGWYDSGIFNMKYGRIQPIYKECPFEVSLTTWFVPNICPNFSLHV